MWQLHSHGVVPATPGRWPGPPGRVLTHGAVAARLQVLHADGARRPARGNGHVPADADLVEHLVFGVNSFPSVAEKEENQVVVISDLPTVHLLRSLHPSLPCFRTTELPSAGSPWRLHHS